MSKERFMEILTEVMARATEPFQFCYHNQHGVPVWVVVDPDKKTWRAQPHQEPGVGFAPRVCDETN